MEFGRETATLPLNGEVQVYVNGKPATQPLFMAAGDSIEFSMPGTLLNGRVAIAEKRIERLQAVLTERCEEVGKLTSVIEDMARASNMNEAIGIAYTSGCLRNDEF